MLLAWTRNCSSRLLRFGHVVNGGLTMSNVHFPVQIVVLFRRLVNVISTLSISNQYLFLTRKYSRVEEVGSGEHEEAGLPKSHPFWSTYFPVLEWQWWTYAAWRNRLTILEEAADILQKPILAHQKVHNTQRIPTRGQHNNNIHPQNEKPDGEVDDIPKHSDTIHHLLQNPALYCPIRAPRYPIVLCHGAL
jgi:triacylglycerol lipase